MNFEILLGFVLATAALAISPGPDNIYVLLQSIANGRKSGLATVAGLITGCLVHTTLLAFGVSAIIKANDTVFFIIKLLGALYLFYLAYQVYQNSATIDLNNSVSEKGMFQLFKQGFIMNVLNPKVAIFFLAFFPSFLFSNSISTVIQFYTLGFLFMFVSTIIFSCIAILAASLAKYIKDNANVGRILKWLQIYVFIAIGVYILLSDK
ncbi:LysE family translocator [Aurantibacter sp.]|uniref:LysE family translocator n=1 Tax=Aurantibacter sp. TaxID=2807103 RepID=UPI003262DD03